MTPLPQRSAPRVTADGRSGGTSTARPMIAGSTRCTYEGSADIWRGSSLGWPSRGAAPAASGARDTRAIASSAFIAGRLAPGDVPDVGAGEIPGQPSLVALVGFGGEVRVHEVDDTPA